MLRPAPVTDVLVCLAFGLALGLIYDLLRPPRRALGRFDFIADLAFCALAALGAFSLAMRDAYGRFGMWSVAAGCAGFLLWLALASPVAAPVAARSWTGVEKLAQEIVKNLKKPLKSVKTLFSNLKSRYIINVKDARGARGDRR